MIRVYVAGPYDGRNVMSVLAHIQAGLKVSNEFMSYGFAVYCPWLDFQLALIDDDDVGVDAYRRNSMAWLEVSDAVFLLPDWPLSPGATAERERALALGKPCFDRKQELFEWAQTRDVT